MNPIRFFYTTILFFSFSFLVAQAPSNNTYQTATELTVQLGSCSTQIEEDLANATNSNDYALSSPCIDGYESSYHDGPNGRAYLDLWYKATVPSSGKLTIQTSAVSGSSVIGMTLFAYTFSDGVETEIDCFWGDTADVSFELTELTENTEIYIMAVESREFIGYYAIGNKSGPFNICAYDPDGTLDFPQTPKPLLSYYSNPVGNRLSVESPYQIQTLRVFDLMGKEVLHKTSQQQKLTLDTYALAPGAYLLQVETPEGEQTVKLIKK